MGNEESKKAGQEVVNNLFIQLPKEIMEKAVKFFNMIDTNNSKTIDREETIKFWGSNFPKLNTNELFSQVDKNNDGTIQLEEWIEFWSLVLKSGHSVEEVSAELDSLMTGGAWVKFGNVDNAKGKSSKMKREGKY